MLVTFAINWLFLPTPPRGRRPGEGVPVCGRACFYPRLREGGDEEPHGRRRGRTGFYPRLREGGDLISDIRGAEVLMFLPTPPRGRRPAVLVTFAINWLFLPTPPRGRRLARWPFFLKNPLFLPTPPRGRRHIPPYGYRRVRIVSTHASAREATPGRRSHRCWPARFYPRLREGGDSGSGLPNM